MNHVMFIYEGVCTIIKCSASIELKCQIDIILHLSFNIIKLNLVVLKPSVGGIAVSIAAFQAVDPGSTPGHRSHFLWTSVRLS